MTSLKSFIIHSRQDISIFDMKIYLKLLSSEIGTECQTKYRGKIKKSLIKEYFKGPCFLLIQF